MRGFYASGLKKLALFGTSKSTAMISDVSELRIGALVVQEQCPILYISSILKKKLRRITLSSVFTKVNIGLPLSVCDCHLGFLIGQM